MAATAKMEDPTVDVEAIEKYNLAYMMHFFVQHKQRFKFPKLRLQDLYHRIIKVREATPFCDIVARIIRYLRNGDPTVSIGNVDKALDHFVGEKRTKYRLAIQRVKNGKPLSDLVPDDRAKLMDNLIECLYDDVPDFNFATAFKKGYDGDESEEIMIKAGQDSKQRSYYYLDDLRLYRETPQSSSILTKWDVVVGPSKEQWQTFINSLSKVGEEGDLRCFISDVLLDVVVTSLQRGILESVNEELEPDFLRTKERQDVPEMRRQRGESTPLKEESSVGGPNSVKPEASTPAAGDTSVGSQSGAGGLQEPTSVGSKPHTPGTPGASAASAPLQHGMSPRPNTAGSVGSSPMPPSKGTSSAPITASQSVLPPQQAPSLPSTVSHPPVQQQQPLPTPSQMQGATQQQGMGPQLPPGAQMRYEYTSPGGPVPPGQGGPPYMGHQPGGHPGQMHPQQYPSGVGPQVPGHNYSHGPAPPSGHQMPPHMTGRYASGQNQVLVFTTAMANDAAVENARQNTSLAQYHSQHPAVRKFFVEHKVALAGMEAQGGMPGGHWSGHMGPGGVIHKPSENLTQEQLENRKMKMAKLELIQSSFSKRNPHVPGSQGPPNPCAVAMGAGGPCGMMDQRGMTDQQKVDYQREWDRLRHEYLKEKEGKIQDDMMRRQSGPMPPDAFIGPGSGGYGPGPQGMHPGSMEMMNHHQRSMYYSQQGPQPGPHGPMPPGHMGPHIRRMPPGMAPGGPQPHPGMMMESLPPGPGMQPMSGQKRHYQAAMGPGGHQYGPPMQGPYPGRSDMMQRANQPQPFDPMVAGMVPPEMQGHMMGPGPGMPGPSPVPVTAPSAPTGGSTKSGGKRRKTAAKNAVVTEDTSATTGTPAVAVTAGMDRPSTEQHPPPYMEGQELPITRQYNAGFHEGMENGKVCSTPGNVPMNPISAQNGKTMVPQQQPAYLGPPVTVAGPPSTGSTGNGQANSGVCSASCSHPQQFHGGPPTAYSMASSVGPYPSNGANPNSAPSASNASSQSNKASQNLTSASLASLARLSSQMPGPVGPFTSIQEHQPPPSQPTQQQQHQPPSIQVNNTFVNAQLNVQQMNYQNVNGPGVTAQMQMQQHLHHHHPQSQQGAPQQQYHPSTGVPQGSPQVAGQPSSTAGGSMYGNANVQIQPKTPHTIQYMPAEPPANQISAPGAPSQSQVQATPQPAQRSKMPTVVTGTVANYEYMGHPPPPSYSTGEIDPMTGQRKHPHMYMPQGYSQGGMTHNRSMGGGMMEMGATTNAGYPGGQDQYIAPPGHHHQHQAQMVSAGGHQMMQAQMMTGAPGQTQHYQVQYMASHHHQAQRSAGFEWGESGPPPSYPAGPEGYCPSGQGGYYMQQRPGPQPPNQQARQSAPTQDMSQASAGPGQGYGPPPTMM